MRTVKKYPQFSLFREGEPHGRPPRCTFVVQGGKRANRLHSDESREKHSAGEYVRIFFGNLDPGAEGAQAAREEAQRVGRELAQRELGDL
jgi:hypothetical protein